METQSKLFYLNVILDERTLADVTLRTPSGLFPSVSDRITCLIIQINGFCRGFSSFHHFIVVLLEFNVTLICLNKQEPYVSPPTVVYPNVMQMPQQMVCGHVNGTERAAEPQRLSWRIKGILVSVKLA